MWFYLFFPKHYFFDPSDHNSGTSIEYNEFKQKWIADTVVVSEQVGKVIDLKERNKFNLFPTINGFLSAVFLKLKDGRFILEISFFNSKYGQEVMRFLPQNEDTIKLYKMRIE